MPGLDERLATTIRRMSCPVHRRKAFFCISNRRMRLDCCCNEFKIICLRELLTVMTGVKKQMDADES